MLAQWATRCHGEKAIKGASPHQIQGALLPIAIWLVPRDQGIDFHAPAIDATGHAQRIGETVLTEPLRDPK